LTTVASPRIHRSGENNRLLNPLSDRTNAPSGLGSRALGCWRWSKRTIGSTNFSRSPAMNWVHTLTTIKMNGKSPPVEPLAWPQRWAMPENDDARDVNTLESRRFGNAWSRRSDDRIARESTCWTFRASRQGSHAQARAARSVMLVRDAVEEQRLAHPGRHHHSQRTQPQCRTSRCRPRPVVVVANFLTNASYRPRSDFVEACRQSNVRAKATQAGHPARNVHRPLHGGKIYHAEVGVMLPTWPHRREIAESMARSWLESSTTAALLTLPLTEYPLEQGCDAASSPHCGKYAPQRGCSSGNRAGSATGAVMVAQDRPCLSKRVVLFRAGVQRAAGEDPVMP